MLGFVFSLLIIESVTAVSIDWESSCMFGKTGYHYILSVLRVHNSQTWHRLVEICRIEGSLVVLVGVCRDTKYSPLLECAWVVEASAHCHLMVSYPLGFLLARS